MQTKTIAETAEVLIQGITVGKEIYQTVLNAMDAAEAEKESGQDKKAWVLAFLESFLIDLGENWDNWVQAIISFIDFAKAFYNQFR
jgi:hypothetical protein